MLLTAFFMGLAGSLHCAAMCGALALATPAAGAGRRAALWSRLVYNAGRIAAYALLGLIFGVIGKSVLLAGLQQSLSIIAGSAMLLFLAGGRLGAANPLAKSSLFIRRIFRKFLAERSYPSIFTLGAANGFLPCGLVYMAGTASIACGNILASSLYMVLFGLGTAPMMLGIGLYHKPLAGLLARIRWIPVAPLATAVVALSLILRGLALGIPYLSPAKGNSDITCPACERAQAPSFDLLLSKK